MLIATKMVLASGMAALALGGPAVVDPAAPDAAHAPRAGFTSVQETQQQQRAQNRDAASYCPAGCSIGQALSCRH